MRILALLFLLGVGCDTPDNTDACDLFEDHMSCPECYDGDVTCSYGDTSVTQGSCGGCQAEAGLYAALCEAGVTDSAAQIQQDMVCEDAPSTEE